MKKIVSIVIIILGLYFCWFAVGIELNKSNHMGSRVILASASIHHELKKVEEYLPEKSKKNLERELNVAITEGKLGFSLLAETVLQLFFSGVCLIVSGFIIYPRKSRDSNA